TWCSRSCANAARCTRRGAEHDRLAGDGHSINGNEISSTPPLSVPQLGLRELNLVFSILRQRRALHAARRRT
ncbi:hypothetical protein CKF46_35710, partial [Klebsiella pneumoniae]